MSLIEYILYNENTNTKTMYYPSNSNSSIYLYLSLCCEAYPSRCEIELEMCEMCETCETCGTCEIAIRCASVELCRLARAPTDRPEVRESRRLELHVPRAHHEYARAEEDEREEEDDQRGATEAREEQTSALGAHNRTEDAADDAKEEGVPEGWGGRG